MSKSKVEDRLHYRVSDPNPYCPVCAEAKEKTTIQQDPDAGNDPGDRQAEGHNCLLSIWNAIYVLNRKHLSE